VGVVLFQIAQEDTPRMLELLTSKYGKPHDTEIGTYTTYGGTQLTGGIYHWLGRSVVITLQERGDRVDRGWVQVTTQAYRDARKAHSESSLDADKEKL